MPATRWRMLPACGARRGWRRGQALSLCSTACAPCLMRAAQKVGPGGGCLVPSLGSAVHAACRRVAALAEPSPAPGLPPAARQACCSTTSACMRAAPSCLTRRECRSRCVTSACWAGSVAAPTGGRACVCVCVEEGGGGVSASLLHPRRRLLTAVLLGGAAPPFPVPPHWPAALSAPGAATAGQCHRPEAHRQAAAGGAGAGRCGRHQPRHRRAVPAAAWLGGQAA